MCEDVFKSDISEGDINMNAVVNKDLDYALAEILKTNEELIKSITLKNPVISQDDEWRNETEWDELYKELKNK